MKHIVIVALALVAMAPAPPRSERAVPFKVGETLTYDVSWSSYLTAGTAVTTVKEKKPSYNSTAYYIVAEGRPTPLLSKLYTLYYKVDTLIDSYTLLIHPLVLGQGQRLFDVDAPAELRLVKSVTTTTGVIIATYEPAA